MADSIDGVMEKLAIIIVTYKRQELLQIMLDSIDRLDSNPREAPFLVVVVDNENSNETKKIVEDHKFHYEAMAENTGGSGGFSKGVEIAYAAGAQWFWLADDDVKFLPDAIKNIEPYAKKFKAIQPKRLDFDGTDLFWQYKFSTKLGILWPLSKSIGDAEYAAIKQICFEGGLMHRDVITKTGLPDARFFIYWDDVVYGYLASKNVPVIYLNKYCLQRTRTLNSLNLNGRKLRSTSDMARYYMFRNRGHMHNYLKLNGDLNKLLFAKGTFLTYIKEAIRILFVDHSGAKSFAQIHKGIKDAKAIRDDKNWKASPKL